MQYKCTRMFIDLIVKIINNKKEEVLEEYNSLEEIQNLEHFNSKIKKLDAVTAKMMGYLEALDFIENVVINLGEAKENERD